MNLYVGNLSFDIDQASLAELFSEYGEVSSANVIIDRETGRSRGFGFVEMPNKQEAIAAMEDLAEAEVNGRKIMVNEAHPKASRY